MAANDAQQHLTDLIGSHTSLFTIGKFVKLQVIDTQDTACGAQFLLAHRR